MNRRTLAAVIAAVAALFTGSAVTQAADPVDLSPLVNDQTLAVARIDLTQIKIRPAADWAIDLVRRAGLPPASVQQAQQGAAFLTMAGQPMIDSLRRAGVNEIGVVVLSGGLANPKPVLLLAVTKPANPQTVVGALAPLNMRSGEKDGLLVFSPNLAPGVLGKLQPAGRPDLTDSTRSTDGAVVVAAAALTEELKTEFAKSVRMPPAGLPEAKLFEDLRQYTLRIDATDGPHVAVKAVTASPESAEKLKAMITQPQDNPTAKMWADSTKVLPIAVDGPAVTLDLKQADMDTVAKELVPRLMNAERAALWVKSQNNLRSLMQLVHLYAANNHGQTPDSLAGLGASAGLTPESYRLLLTNPVHPELGANGYVFLPRAGKLGDIKTSGTVAAIYEAGPFGEGMNVAFWDGHVERIKDPAKFDALIKAAPPATTGPAAND